MPNKKKLYEALKQEGYTNFADEKSFNDYINDADNRRTLFNALKEEGYDNFADEVEFDDYLGYSAPIQHKTNPPIHGGVGTQEEADSIFDANMKRFQEGKPIERVSVRNAKDYSFNASEDRPSLQAQVKDSETVFPKVEDMPWNRPQGGKDGHVSNEDLGYRLKKVYEEGGMEPFVHQDEDAKVKEEYKAKPAKTTDDVWNTAKDKFALTERGQRLQSELADIQKGVSDKYMAEFMKSKEYQEYANKKYTTQEEADNANKAINELFGQMYGNAIIEDMKPYMEAYNNEVYNRYEPEIETGLKSVAKADASANLNTLSSSVDEELTSIEEQITNRRNAVRNVDWKPGMPSKRDDRQLAELRGQRTYLEGAKELIEESQQIVDAANAEKDGNFFGGLGRGVRDTAFDIDNWTMGLSDLVGGLRLKSVLEKAEKGEELTKAEESLLDASVNNMAINYYFGSDLGRGYKAGQVTGESLPFILEMIINPISGSGNAIAKSLLKHGLKKFGRVATTDAAKFGGRLVGDALAASGMATTTGMPAVLGEAVQRMNENYDYNFDEEGNLKVSKVGDTSFGEAMVKSFATRAIENQSEMIFNAFGKWSPLNSIAKNVGDVLPDGVNGFINRIKNSKPAEWYREIKNNPTLREVAQRAQFHGLPEEYFEEVYNNFANVALGEMTMDEALDLDNNIDTFIGLAPMSVAFGMVGLGGMAVERYNNRKKLERIFGRMTDEQKAKLKELQEMGKLQENTDIREFIKATMADESLTPEQKREEIEYAYEIAKNNAMNEVTGAETEDTIEAQNAAIDAATDPQTGMYGEVHVKRFDDKGEEVQVPANVFGEKIVNGELYLLVQEEGSDEKYWVKPSQYYAETYQSMPAEEVKAEAAEIVQEEAERRMAEESKYAPEVINAQMQQNVPFETADAKYVPIQPMLEGSGWQVEVYAKDENGKPAKMPVIEEMSNDAYRDILQQQYEQNEAVQEEAAKVEASNQEIVANMPTKAFNDGTGRVAQPVAVQGNEVTYNIADANGTVLEQGTMDMAKFNEMEDAAPVQETVGQSETAQEGAVEVNPVAETAESPTEEASMRGTVGSPVALAYLLEGGQGSIENLGYFLHGVAGAFPEVENEIEAIRGRIGAEGLGVSPNRFAEVASSQMNEMRNVIVGRYGEAGGVLFDSLVKNSTGFVPREGAKIAKLLESLEVIENQEPTPVGKGVFGEIYDQFKGKAKEAIEFLKKKKSGEAIGALHHNEIGDIDLVWGKEGTGKSNGFGLSKLVKYHPEVLDNLQEILDNMVVVRRSENRINLESDTHKAAIRLEWDGVRKNWLLTAFEKEMPTATDRTTDIGDTKLQNDTAPLQTDGISSENKDKSNNVQSQENQGDFVSMGKEKAFEVLGNKYGQKMPNKIAVTAKAYAEDLKKAQQKLEKAEEDYDNAPVGREDKAEKARDKAKQELEAVKREADFWSEMDAEVKQAQAKREALLNARMEEFGYEPMSADEFIAQQLANGNITLLSDSFKKETGFGENERKKFLQMFRTKENGGMSIEEAGDVLMQMDREAGTNFFDQSDANAGRDALINFLGSVAKWGDVTGHIRNNRQAQAMKEAEGIYNEVEDAIMRAYHTTLEDYVNQMEAAEVENPFLQERPEETMAIFVEEEAKYEQSLNNIDNGQAEGNITEGSGTVLSEEQADDTGGTEEQQESQRNGLGTPEESESAHDGASGSEVRYDNQGNPVDEQGNLIIEAVSSIDEITDKDFIAPARSIAIPDVPKNVADAIGTNGKPIIIKKNVFEKNHNTHKEVSAEKSREILKSALYNPDLVGQTQPIRRPDYKVAIHTGEKNSVVVLDVYQGKDNVEIVGWRFVDTKGLDKMKRQSEREGGQFLILSPNDGSAAALSALPFGLSSDSKDSNLSEENKENGKNVAELKQKEGESILQFAERVAEENRRRPLRQRANEWSKALGVKVTFLESIDEVNAETRAQIEAEHAKGSGVPAWVAPNGEVYFFMPDLRNVKDVDETYIHEVVAHIGLEKLLGKERFAELCDKVWDMMPQSEKDYYEKEYPGVKNIQNETKRHRAAADEYMAHLAEKESLTPEEQTIWDKIVKYMRDVLDRALNGMLSKSNITNEDISNLIKMSYANLKSGSAENVGGEGNRFSAKKVSERRQEMNRINETVDQAQSIVYGKDVKEIRKERQKREQKRKEDAAEIYESVLKGDFNDVTLQKINDYIDDATPLHPYGRRISQRLPQKLERSLHEGSRTNAVDALFSRIHESAVPASRRASEAGRREIEERKKESLKGWAIATNNWHTDLSDFTDEQIPIGEGTDSKVYASKDGKYVIKTSFGKPEGKRFRPDIDNIPLFNSVFRNSAYEIVGYGEFDGKFARILKQPFVDFAEVSKISEDERVEYMHTLGFEPINDAKTAFSNGTIIVADLQKSNIVKDAKGNIRVIDADVKLHTKDVGGNYSYPPVEADLPEGTRFRTLEQINKTFNDELQQQIDGTLPQGHIYQLGSPSAVLQACGFPNMPIELSSTNLAEHSRKTRHPFELKDVKGLVYALQKPVAVFSYGDKKKSQNVIVEIQKNDRNFLIGVHFNQNRNGLEVSSIRGVFPKDSAEWLNWISQDKALYLNKEKIQDLILKQRKTLADVKYLDLDSVANIVKDFPNPTIPEEKSRFRVVYHGSGASFDKFDHSFMSTGEGNQSYGWGTYVTEVEGIGRQYANLYAKNSPLAASALRWIEENGTYDDFLAQGEGKRRNWAIRHAKDYLKELKEEGASEDVIKAYEQDLVDAENALSEENYNRTKENMIASLNRNLYTVDIPDNDGTNYIEWDKPLSEDNKKRIKDAVLNSQMYKDYAAKYGDDVSLERLNSWLNAFDAGRVYRLLENFADNEDGTESAKQISMLLSDAGYTGFEYPSNFMSGGNENGSKNYVIFNEDDLNIVDHTRFRVKDKNELVAVHNISEDNLRKVLSVGGLIMPSIAITKADMGHEGYGEISLLFDKETINPSDRRNKVYGGDAWTPRFPQMTAKINDKVSSKVYKKIRDLIEDRALRELYSLSAEMHPDNIGRNISNKGVEGYYNEQYMKHAYLLDNGKKVKVPMRMKDYGDMSETIIEMAKERGLTVSDIQQDSFDFYQNNPDFVNAVKMAVNEKKLNSFPEEKRETFRNFLGKEEMRFSYFDTLISAATRMEYDLEHGGLKQIIDKAALRESIEKKVKTNNADYNKWVDNLFEGIVEKYGIRNDRDWYTPSGNLRPWNQLYDDATPANILRYMLAENEQGGSGGFFDSNIMGASAETYGSIEEIREKGKKRLRRLDEGEYDEWSNSLAERMSEICYDFLSPSQRNEFGASIDAKVDITNAVAKDKTAKGIYKAMKRDYPGFTMEHAKQVEEIVKEIQDFAIGYFEAKPRRIVPISEVRKAVVPKNTSKDILDGLKENGIDVATYKKGDEAARARLIKKESNGIRFRMTNKEKEELRDSEETKALFDYAKKRFGRTFDLREAGYILPDGAMLDFSGRHEMSPGSDTSFLKGQRSVDHRYVADLNYETEDNGGEKTAFNTDMADFINRGAIRIDGNVGSINLTMIPTKDQKAILQRMIQRLDGDVWVDFSDGWDTEHSAEYSGVRPFKVLGDIDRYYNEGVKPEGYTRFRIANQNQEIFVSNAQRAVEGIKQEKATPQQWLAMIEKNGGLKAGEDKWLGLSDWLKEQMRGSIKEKPTTISINGTEYNVNELETQIFSDIKNILEDNGFNDELVGVRLVGSYMRGEQRPDSDIDVIAEYKGSSSEDTLFNVLNDNDSRIRIEGVDVDINPITEFKSGTLDEWEKRNAGFTKKPTSLTKDEILNFIGQNKIRIEEVKYGEENEAYKEADEELASFYLDMEEKYGSEYFDEMDSDELAQEDKLIEARDKALSGDYSTREINSTRLNYTTEGLENKAEIALTVPTIEPWNEDDEIHFGDAGEGRAVAWIRFGETTTPNVTFINAREAVNNYIAEMREKYNVKGGGIYDVMNEEEVKHLQELTSAEFDTRDKVERVLVIDEIQSKRHQEGREHGYRSNSVVKELERLMREANEKNDAYFSRLKELKSEFGLYTISEEVEKDWRDSDAELAKRYEAKKSAGIALADFRKENERALNRNVVPEAPFEKNWHELAMKRMLRYAAENGYDKVAWTKGAQQAERYNIGGVVESIDYFLRGDGTYRVETYGKNGYQIDSVPIEYKDGQALSEVFGKELATKMVKDLEEDKEKVEEALKAKKDIRDKMRGMDEDSAEYEALLTEFGKYDSIQREADKGHSISGDGLRIGGEGMKGFYDEILPRFMNKYGKKWGTKVQDIELPNVEEAGQIMHSVDVTDAMKESVMEGQTMFRIKREKIQEEVDKFTSKYKSAPVNVIDKNITEEEFKEWIGDEVTKDEFFKWLPMSKSTGGYVRAKGKIVIFADKVKRRKDVEKILFHENLHVVVANNEIKELMDNFYGKAKDKREFARWKKLSDSDEYLPSERVEEFFVYSVSNGQLKGDLEDVFKQLSSNEQKQLLNLLKDNGYVYEEEAERRRTVLGRLRNWGRSVQKILGEKAERQKERSRRSREEAERLKQLFDKVADMGLDGVLGNKDYINLMVDIYNAIPEDVRIQVAGDALRHYGGDVAPAVSDYINVKAKADLWDKVVGFVKEALRKAGFDLNLTANDVKYIMWRSQKPINRESILDMAEDIDKKYTLGVGEYEDSPTRFRAKKGSGVKVDADEYAKISYQIATYPNKVDRGHVFTDNNYYLCTDIDEEGNFKVVAQLKIEGNEELINRLRGENGRSNFKAIEGTEDIASTVAEVRSRGGRTDRNIPTSKRQSKINRRNDSVHLGQQTDPTTDKQSSDSNDGKRTSFRVAKDSQGRELSDEQKKFFANSKVVDKDGNLLVVYHGSGENDFNTFEKGDVGYHFGNYDQAMMRNYMTVDHEGIIKPYYLNINNPLYINGDARNWNGNGLAKFLLTENDEFQDGSAFGLKQKAGASLNPFKSEEDMERLKGISEMEPDESNDAMRGYLQSKDYDGIIYTNDVEVSPDDSENLSYIAFEPNQIKLTNNTEPTADNDIRFRTSVANKLGIRDEYERLIKKGGYQAREAVQDSMLSLRRVQEMIEKATDKKLRGFENAWMHENRLSSVVQAEIQDMEKKFYKPMIGAVKKFMDAAHLKDTEVADYLMLKHQIERNREMAVRKALTDEEGKLDRTRLEQWYKDKRDIRNDANLPTWREKQEAMDAAALNYGADMSVDYSGLTSMFDKDDLAYCTDKAYLEVEALEKGYQSETEALNSAVKAMNQNTLDAAFGSGLMDRKVYDELSNDMYDYYIPLRGFEETTSDEVYAYMDNDRGAFNAPLRRAHGRTSKSDNPLAYMKSIAESGIMQGNRNKMKQTFLNMVLNNPSDLVSVKEGVWAVFNPATGDWEAASAPAIPANATPADVEAIMEQWEQSMEQQAANNANVKKIREADDIPYRVIGNRISQHQVIVKRLGKSYTLTINGNPRLAMALNGQTNPNNTSNDGKVAAYVSGKIDSMNRFLSAWYTTRNPDFVASNFMRDTFYTNTIVRAKEGNKYANKFHKHYAELLMPGRMMNLFRKYESGTLDPSDKLEKNFLDFMMNGGETGYSNLKDLEHIKSRISKELKGSKWLQVEKVAEKLDIINRAVENTSRFAAFLTSREMGRGIEQSVFDAKEISVNFNRKGAGGTFYRATGQNWFGNLGAVVGASGRALYVFFNAAIQGTTNLMHVMRKNPVGTSAGIAAMFLMGAVVPFLLDDDDEKDYYDIPEYVRRSHLILPGSGDAWVSIPLPIEYRIMYGMGELLTSWRTGHERGSDIARKMLNLTGQALPLNFMEEGLDAFVPSAVSPLWQSYTNTSWTGLPIYRESDFNKDDPEYTKVYKNTDRNFVKFTKALYEWTFDEENQEAGIDLNPAIMETIARGYFGGAFTTMNNLAKTWSIIEGDREFDWRNIPIANRIMKSGNEQTKEKRIANEYFNNIEKLEFLQSRERTLKKTRNGIAVPEKDRRSAEDDLNQMIDTEVYRKYQNFKAAKKKVDKIHTKMKKDGETEELRKKLTELQEEANGKVR